jgi:hypothetical protein
MSSKFANPIPAQAVSQVAERPGVLRQIMTAPFGLISSLGHGLVEGSHAGSLEAARQAHVDPQSGALGQAFRAIPDAIMGFGHGFSENRGLRNAALTGLGGLAAYGGKTVYDDVRDRYMASQQSGLPGGYYMPGGY